MFTGLQARLGLISAAFAALVLVSTGAMVWGLETQKQDALLIYLAGRQRMLSQQMARLAFDAGAGESTANQSLQEAELIFQQTLYAMRDGGEAPYMPGESVSLAAARDPKIRLALQNVDRVWADYRLLLDELQQTPPLDPRFDELVGQIRALLPGLDSQLHEVVHSYEQDTVSRLAALRSLQIGFLAAALVLLLAGALVTRRSILAPLRELSLAAERLGRSDLDTPVEVEGPRELRALSMSFDGMRKRLRAARLDLLELTSALESRVNERTRELNALHEVSHEITSQLDVKHVLHSVTDKVRTLLDGDSAMLCLLDESQEYLRLKAVSGRPLIPVYESYMSTVNHASQALNSRRALLCKGDACVGGCGFFSGSHAPSHMVAPLRIGDKIIGALCVGSRQPDHFTEDSAELLTRLSNTAAIALQNAQLYTQAERVAVLEERQRVAAEMHDGLGQMLSYLGLMTDQTMEFVADGRGQAAMQRLDQTRQTIEKATGEVRRAITNLIHEPLTSPNLCAQLQNAVSETSAQMGVPIAFHVEVGAEAECPPPTLEQVVNITREALQNAARHAQAAHISVRLRHDPAGYCIEIEDDGRGFDTSRPGPNGHFGLQIMQARAAHIGGQAEFCSAPGQGTRVKLIWPAGKEGP